MYVHYKMWHFFYTQCLHTYGVFDLTSTYPTIKVKCLQLPITLYLIQSGIHHICDGHGGLVGRIPDGVDRRRLVKLAVLHVVQLDHAHRGFGLQLVPLGLDGLVVRPGHFKILYKPRGCVMSTYVQV